MVLRLGSELSAIGWVWIEVIGLGFVAWIPHVRSHMAMLTTLIERWRSKAATFHLLKGEIIITLEDVYWIYRPLI